MSTEAVEAALPELADIDSASLRTGVGRAWATAMSDNEIDDLGTVPWYPPAQRELDRPDERLIPHVREVARGAVALAAVLSERFAIDEDIVLAGALVHDVSKCYEFDDGQPTGIGTLLGHPHYGVHVVAAAGLPVEVQHVVLAHTRRSAVDPRTIEAAIVRRADEAAAAAIRFAGRD